MKPKTFKRAYKVFSSDWTCRNMQYQMGQTFEISGELSLCTNGMHYCDKLADCFNYYDFNPENKVAEIEILGDIVTEGDKSCTNKLRLVTELTWNEVLELVNTGKYNTGKANSGNYNSGYRNSGYRNSGDYNSGYCNSGDYNSGNYNSGDYNSGYRNSGDHNSGYCNSGYRNSGDHNSGNYNSGYYNSGDYNSGDYNSGNYNSGDYNSGYRNSGDGNSGDYNSGNYNSGLFNTDEPAVRLFNKQTTKKRSEIDIPYINLPLNQWIEYTEAEMKEDPKKAATKGFLKSLSYKDSWKLAWENAGDDLKQQFLDLPGFDAGIFEEITGIKVKGKKKLVKKTKKRKK